MAAGVETFVTSKKYGWRLRTAAGIEVTRAAAFATAELAKANAAADIRLAMTSLGIVEAPSVPADLVDLDL